MAAAEIDESILETLEDFVNEYIYSNDAPFFHAVFIENCNGSFPHSFRNASVDYRMVVPRHKCMVWFDKGFQSILQAIDGCNAFKGRKTFDNLINNVFNETKHLDCLKLMNSDKELDKVKIKNSLAIHYFKPLIYDSECFIDKGSSDVCEYCNQKVKVGDTSLGNGNVWHGKTDIVCKNSVIRIEKDHKDDQEEETNELVSGEPESSSEEGPDLSSIIDIELKETNSIEAKSQALAVGIVNAFCEATRDESFFDKLIPSFLVTEKSIQIIMYSCKLDILLLSDELEIWEEEGLNKNTLLLVWLALNFDEFDMEVSQSLLEVTTHSDFKKKIDNSADYHYLKKMSKPLELNSGKKRPKKLVSYQEIEALRRCDTICYNTIENFRSLKKKLKSQKSSDIR